MPELPEVETVVTALGRALAGRRFLSARFIGKVRTPFDADAVTAAIAGRKVTGVRRRAKSIIIDMEGRVALLAHLGMTGYFHLEPASLDLHKHDRLAFPLADGEELRFADARRFGYVKLVDLPAPGGYPAELAGLGPEPLDRTLTGQFMLERAAGRKCPVKTFIMDQAVLVGVGNIYACEALFGAGVDPRKPAGRLDLPEWKALVAEIKSVLRQAIKKGGSTIRDYRTVDGGEGGFQRALRIYGKGKGACPVCGAPVEVVRLGGRSTFFCPRCQGG